MLYINIKRVMRLRGVDNHYKRLLDLGFAPATARNFLKNAVWRITFENLERLCLALNCTPNDLLEWLPSDTTANPQAQALSKLKRNRDEDLPTLLNEMPMDKFDQLITVLQDLKGKE